MDIFLGKISQDIKQKIYECIFQALCEDRQEADAYIETLLMLLAMIMSASSGLQQYEECGLYYCSMM